MNFKSDQLKFYNINHGRRLLMMIFLLLFLALNLPTCNKDTPVEPNDEKDGIITIRFKETCWDTTGGHSHLLDTLNVSEETNVIDIPNAVPFDIPSLSSVAIYFWGDFTGVQDTIFVWLEYNDPYKEMQRATEITQLAKNETCISLSGYGSKPIEHTKGYIFILDTDNNNTGTGFVRFEGQSLDEKVWVDAAKNTVCYVNNSAMIDFNITCMPFHPEGYEATNIHMYSLDYDSFKIIPDRAICVLQIKKDNSTSIVAFSTYFGYGDHYLPCSIRAYGFAPNFKKDLKIYAVCDKELDKLELASTPWLTNEDIRFYDWSSHCMYLKKDKMELKKYLHYNDGWNEPYLWSKPYIVTSYQKRCYMGYFSVFCSTLYLLPMIDVSIHILGYPEDVLSSWWIYLYRDDIRNNEDVRKALIQQNLFHGGISVALDTTHFILTTNKTVDTTTVEYTIKITNQDQDNLYILDPELMKKELFFYFYNGLAFYNINNDKLYYAIDSSKTPVPNYYSWYAEWFIKLAPGQTINRTIKQNYSNLPSGRYIFQTAYTSPILTMEKEVREISDGRYWLGKCKSRVYGLTIEENYVFNSGTFISVTESILKNSTESFKIPDNCQFYGKK